MYVPDARFPGDKYDIPILDITKQGEYLEAPVKMWGNQTRKQKFAGTFGFYTPDYKFTALWKHPDALFKTGCHVAIEPNFSTSPDYPEALVIADIYKKRWIARWWQVHNIRIIVDLNVSEQFFELNMIGVPDGWQCFATRAHKRSHHLIPKMYDLACEKAHGTPRLFLVYGGGLEIQEMCKARHWLWLPEQMQVIKELYYGV